MRTKASPSSSPYAQVTTSGGRGRGFTLVEVLLAMVLTVVLMTALMMVASSSMQDRRRLAERQQEAEPVWLGQVAWQIEADLLMGSGVSGPLRVETPAPAPGSGMRLYILTHSSPEGGSSHLPVLVSYRLMDSQRGGVLLREERTLTKPEGVTGTATQKSGVQVVATGIDAIQIGGTTLSLESDARRVPAQEARNNSAFTMLVDNRPVAMQPVAPQLRLAITASGSNDVSGDSSDAPSRTYTRTLLTQ